MIGIDKSVDLHGDRGKRMDHTRPGNKCRRRDVESDMRALVGRRCPSCVGTEARSPFACSRVPFAACWCRQCCAKSIRDTRGSPVPYARLQVFSAARDH